MSQLSVVQFMILINAVGLIQSLSLAVSLSLNKSRKLITSLLAVLMVSLAAVIGNTILILLDFREIIFFYQYLANAFSFLLGPMLGLIVKHSLAYHPLRHRSYLHGLPFIIYFSFGAISNLAIAIDADQESFWTALDRWIIWIWNVHFGAYLIWAFIQLKAAQSRLGKEGLWLKRLVIAFISIYLLNFVFHAINQWVKPIPDEVTLNITVLLSFIVMIIVYRSQSSPIRPIAATLVNDEQIDQLRQLFDTEKIFTRQDLSVNSVAERMGTTSKSISTLINTHFQKNFNEFVNEYRVKEVLKMIEQNEQNQLTIIGMAEEAGFHSNSAFYRAFKQHTGTTPKAYMAKHC